MPTKEEIEEMKNQADPLTKEQVKSLIGGLTINQITEVCYQFIHAYEVIMGKRFDVDQVRPDEAKPYYEVSEETELPEWITNPIHSKEALIGVIDGHRIDGTIKHGGHDRGAVNCEIWYSVRVLHESYGVGIDELSKITGLSDATIKRTVQHSREPGYYWTFTPRRRLIKSKRKLPDCPYHED